MRTAILLATCLLLVACGSSTPGAVGVTGSPSDLQMLGGTWRGEYESHATGRKGSIVFRFEEGAVGYGDVTMTPVPEPSEPHVPQEGNRIHRHAGATVIAIREVIVNGNEVRGELEPYVDPDDGSSVKTTFAGQITGDVITGSFEMLEARYATPLRGTWSVRRVSDSVPSHSKH